MLAVLIALLPVTAFLALLVLFLAAVGLADTEGVHSPDGSVKVHRVDRLGREIRYRLFLAHTHEQARRLIHTSNLVSHPYQGLLAEKLCEWSGLDRVFFANSGAEAMEAALKPDSKPDDPAFKCIMDRTQP